VRIAVVGGGIFGCTAAIALDRAGHDVHLLEAKDSILRCASGINQFRLHAGYHYPRSRETIEDCRAAIQSFCELYGAAVDFDGEHYYAIARSVENQTSASEYLYLLQDIGMGYEIASPEFANPDAVELVIRAHEGWINIGKLRSLVWEYFATSNIDVHLQAAADNTLLDEFDTIVVACYASQGKVLSELGCSPGEYQFEWVEKPVVKMLDSYQNKGLVVMDGPFCSLDPFLGTPYHLLGHVDLAVLERTIGLAPASYLDIDEGIRPHQLAETIRLAVSEYVPEVQYAEIIGSMFTVRTVLPDVEDTDERPTIVTKQDSQVISIFSGKIGTAVQAANQVVEMLR